LVNVPKNLPIPSVETDRSGVLEKYGIAAPTASTSAGDVIKELAAGATSGVGMTVKGAGVAIDEAIAKVRGKREPTRIFGRDPLEGVTKSIRESKTLEGEMAMRDSTPEGDLFKPSTWSLGKYPSIGGYAQQAAAVFGQFAPQLAVAAGMRKASPGTQMAVGAGVGAAQGGGAGASEEGERIRGMKHEDLIAGSPEYSNLLSRGRSPEQAKEELAQIAEAGGALGAAVPASLGGVAEQALLRGRIRIPKLGGPVTTAAGAAVGGGLFEGGQEVAEGVGQRLVSGLATGESRDLTEESFANAVLGAIGGGALAGGVSIINGESRRVDDEPGQPVATPEATPMATPAGPVSRAAAVATGGSGEASNTLFGFTQEGANKRAELLTQQGTPSKVVPHPTREGRFAVIPDQYGAAMDDRGRIEALLGEANTLIDAMPEGGVTLPRGVVTRLREIDGELEELRDKVAPQKAGKLSEGKVLGESDEAQGQDIPIEQRVKAALEVPPFQRTARDLLILRQNRMLAEKLQAEAQTPDIAAAEGVFGQKVERVDDRAHEAATSPQNDRPEPTDAQKEAGNYKKGPAKVGGLNVAIENPVGSVRRAKADAPKQWETTMQAHYGYFKGKGVRAIAPDKDRVDTFIKPGTPADYDGPVFVVDQNREDGQYDEPKVMVGYGSEAEARAAYLAHYEAGWESRIRGIAGLTMDQLRTKLRKRRSFMKPMSDLAALQDPEMRGELERMAGETGWAEIGGRMIRDTEGNVADRTKWVPRAAWWPGRPDGMSEDGVKTAVRKALAGEELSPGERRMVEYLIQQARLERAEFDAQSAATEEYTDEELRAVGFDEATEQEQNDALELADDIVSSVSPSGWATMSEADREKELDDIFGEKPAAQKGQEGEPESAGDGAQAGPPQTGPPGEVVATEAADQTPPQGGVSVSGAEFWQWQRNAQGGQAFGNKQRIEPITAELWDQHVRPRTQKTIRSFNEWKIKNPDATHISLIDRADGKTIPGNPFVGSVESLRPSKDAIAKGWVRQVESIDSDEARQFGGTADADEVSTVTAMRDALLGLIDAKESMNAIGTIKDAGEKAAAMTEAKAGLEKAQAAMRKAYGKDEATPLLEMSVTELYDLYEAAAGIRREEVDVSETAGPQMRPLVFRMDNGSSMPVESVEDAVGEGEAGTVMRGDRAVARISAAGQITPLSEGDVIEGKSSRVDDKPQLELTGETPADLTAKAQQEAARQMAEAAKALKETADQMRESFTLTGSNRTADEAAARGQGDLLASPAEPQEQKPKKAFTFAIKPVDGGFVIESDDGGGMVMAGRPGPGILNNTPPRVFPTRDEALTYMRDKGMTLATEKRAEAPAKPASGGTDDVGENLWYNRRNFTGKAITWNDVEGLNDTLRVKEVVKSKVWPRPDYEQLVNDGMQPFFARMLKQVYDGIATEPAGKTDADLQRYIDVVGRVREAVFDWAKDNNANREFMNGLLPMIERARARTISLMDLSKPSGIKDVILDRVWPGHADRGFFRGEAAAAEARAIGGNRALRHLQFDMDDAINAMKDLDKGWPAKQQSWQRQGITIKPASGTDISEGGYTENGVRVTRWFVNTTAGFRGRQISEHGSREEAEAAKAALKPFLLLDKRNRLMSQHDTQAEAEAAARESVKRESGMRDTRGMNISRAERTGPDRRAADEDVSAERLMETFGFRGVNFGREGWINKNERQVYLNHAYDGLMDLADILNVPPKALSLDGLLGIAFGAQGRGGSAAAHFVPGVNEINLTKTMGAGTLAHEWGHALDHYFGVQHGAAKSASPFMSAQLTGLKDSTIRPEILALFRGVVQAMERKPLTAAEVEQRKQETIDRAKRNVEGWGKNIRASLTNAIKGDSRDQVLAEYGQLLERLLRGDVGEGYVQSGNMSVSPTIAQVRNLFKESTGRLLNTDDTKALEANARWLRSALAGKEATDAHIPQGATTYSRESYAADRAKSKSGGKRYWSTPWEMFARAFEMYVASRLEAQGQANTFLSDAALRADMPNREGTGFAYPYPRGEERTAINEAIGKLVAEIKTRETDRGVAMFSRSEGIDFAADFVTELAAHDELFRHRVSASTDLGTVFEEVAPTYRFMGDDTRADERNESGADRRYAVVTPKRKVFHIYERGNEVWIDVSRLDPGEGGNFVYAAVLNYAHNAKKVLIGDPAAVSQDAVVRRTVAMLSSALRFGTTRHMRPAAEQTEGNPAAGIAPLEWGSDEAQNVRNLIDTFLQTTYNQNPEIEGIRYDFAGRKFVENGKPVTQDRFNELAATFRDRTGRSGQASIRRAGLLQSLVRSESGERPGLLQDVFRRGAEHVSRGMAAHGPEGSGQELPNLRGAFSRTEAPERGLSVSERRTVQRVEQWIAGPLSKLKNIRDVRVVYRQSDIPYVGDRLRYLNSVANQDAAALREWIGFVDRPVEAFYDGKTIWMVASSLPTQKRALEVLEHEAVGHLAVDAMLNEADPKLRARLIRQVQLLDAGGNKYIRGLAAIVDSRQPGLKKDQRAAEIIALVAERGDQVDSVRSIYRQIIDGIKAFFKLVFDRNLSDSDVRDIVSMAGRWAQGEAHVTEVVDGVRQSVGVDIFSRAEAGVSDTIDVDGNPRPRLNSEGRPIAQSDQTETPAFLNWFKGSKVVDANGKPLVVYHGTGADFTAFDRAKAKRGNLGDGFYFTPNPEEANAFAGKSTFNKDGGNVIPAYISLQNPAIVRGADTGAERAGHDGIIQVGDDGRIKTVVAFRPEQIKSAVGNRGTFDPGNADIRFSRAAVEPIRARLIESIKSLGVTGELAQDEGVLNVWNKTVGTPELVARKNPAFAKVFWEGQEYLNDVNRFVSEAEEMLPSWFKGQDILSRWFDRVRGKEVAQAEKATEALLDGTLDNKVFTTEELRARGLSDKEIGMYEEARRAIDTMIEKVGLSVIAKVAPEYAPVVEQMMATYRAHQQDGLEAMMGIGEAELKAEIAALQQRKLAGEAVDPEIKAAQAKLDDWQVVLRSFERIHKLQENGYFPLSRFGSHYVNVMDPHGETVEFRMYETDAFARIGTSQMAKKYPSNYRIERGTVSQDTPELFRGLTPESVELFAEIAGLSKDPVMQQYLKEAVANRSMLKRMIHRKGTPGYSKDAVRVLADFISSNARYWSRLSHFDKLQEYAHDIRGGELRDYAISLVKYLRGDDGREEFQKTRGFLFFQYIGGNISSALLNLSQVPMFTAPWLTQHTNALNVGRLLTRAYKMAVLEPAQIQGELGEALRLAEEEGITDPQNVYTTMAIGSGSKVARIRAFSGLLDAWAFLFSKAETLNRRTTFIAAHELATSQGKHGKEAFDFAVQAVQDTQFIYNKGNRPQWARGIGAIPFTFKIFLVAALEFIFSKMPPKQAAMVLALMLLAAGLEGLPFAEDLQDIIDGLGQKLGYPTNSKRWLAENLQAAFQEWLGLPPQTALYAAEMVRRGVFANTPLASMGARVGMGNLIPGTAMLQTGRDPGRDIMEAIGPAAGFAGNVAQGMELAARGEYARAAERALPSGVANMFKGARQFEAGEEVTPYGRRVAPVSKPEAALQAIGIYPGSLARTREREQMIKQDELYLKTVESRIANKWASGIVSGDPEKVREAQEELRAHNQRNPNARIRITPQQVYARVRNMRREGLASTIRSVAPERRADAREFLNN